MRRFTLSLCLSFTSLIAVAAAEAGAQEKGAVYALGNDAAANAVLVFTRDGHGQLAAHGQVATGGRGSGAGLGSQGAIIKSGPFVFAVNAGSNDVSAFVARGDDLRLVARASSGGTQPVSVTYRDGLLYVVNAGGSGNIAGLVFDGHALRPLSDSSRPLSSAAAGPAQIAFSPAGDRLVVTEKNTSRIVTYDVGFDGRPGAPVVHPSAGVEPFGFAFVSRWDGGYRDVLVVSEAFTGAVDGSATSSYELHGDGALTTETASLSAGQTAACWVAIADHGRIAYAINAGSADVSSYRVHGDGQLTLADAVAGQTSAGGAPSDAAVSGDGRFLFVRSGGTLTIDAFAIGHDGALAKVATLAGLPKTTVGLAAD